MAEFEEDCSQSEEEREEQKADTGFLAGWARARDGLKFSYRWFGFVWGVADWQPGQFEDSQICLLVSDVETNSCSLRQ